MGRSYSKENGLKEIAENVKISLADGDLQELELNQKQMKYADTVAYVVFDVKTLPRGPTKLLDHLYLGNCSDARNRVMLKEIGITHICNTVENDGVNTGKEYYGENFNYLGFSSNDNPYYPILKHFDDVYNFIENARKSNGICFIHCMAGINRSGCLATAYVMIHENIGPITACEKVKKARGMLLSNSGFIKCLVKFGDDKGLLELDKKKIIHNIPSQFPSPSKLEKYNSKYNT